MYLISHSISADKCACKEQGKKCECTEACVCKKEEPSVVSEGWYNQLNYLLKFGFWVSHTNQIIYKIKIPNF